MFHDCTPKNFWELIIINGYLSCDRSDDPIGKRKKKKKTILCITIVEVVPWQLQHSLYYL
jgi:hypothetical protein